MSGIRQRLKEVVRDHDNLYHLASRLKLTKPSRVCRELGARLGFDVQFPAHAIVVERPGERVLFAPSFRPFQVMERMERWSVFRQFLEFSPAPDGERVADCRGERPYRLPSGDRILLPSPPKPVDLAAGPLAKGGPQPGDLVLDVGAGCGEVTLELARRAGPRGRIVALEPDPVNLALLRSNLGDWGLGNVEVLPLALWSETGRKRIRSRSGASSAAARGSSSFRYAEAVSPADLVRRIGRFPDFIRMDIGGAEVEVMDALMPLLRGVRTRLAIASYHPRGAERSHYLIEPALRQAGLSVETGNPEHLTTWAWAG